MSQPDMSSVRTSQVIYHALWAGVAMFYGVVVFLNIETGFDAVMPVNVAVALIAAVSLGSLAIALMFKRQIGDILANGKTAHTDEEVRKRSIFAWAVLEGAAIFAGVFFLLTNYSILATIGAAVYIIGLLMTRPTPDQYADTTVAA